MLFFNREAAGGGVLVEGDDAVLRGGDEVVEVRRLQRRREPAGRHRRRRMLGGGFLLGLLWSEAEPSEQSAMSGPLCLGYRFLRITLLWIPENQLWLWIPKNQNLVVCLPCCLSALAVVGVVKCQ